MGSLLKLKRFLFGQLYVDPFGEGPRPTAEAPDYTSLFVTGPQLVERVRLAVVARRPVLLTGPRGSGKSYCANEGIRKAIEEGAIGFRRFLQGNREIPRDTLSEDMLIVADPTDGASAPPAGRASKSRLETLVALALRPMTLPGDTRKHLERQEAERARQHPDFTRLRQQWQREFRTWPAVPEMAITKPKDPERDPTWCWLDAEWWALFLDEINRFGDGFLDSLLSLTEEGKIVRRGEEYRIPAVVVATANPPGYDPTAKKLSPPLQARIARAYRVTQPPPEDLVCILEARFRKDLRVTLENVTLETAFAVAAVLLCLWGDPNAGTAGTHYLSVSCQRRLRAAKKDDSELAALLTQLSGMIEFGPDARAAGDWVDAACGLVAPGEQVRTEHLLATVCEVLANKVRENFSEGNEPGKVSVKEQCLVDIAERVLADVFAQPPRQSRLRPHFFDLYEAVRRLLPAGATERERWGAAVQLWQVDFLRLPPGRRGPWLSALALLPEAFHAEPSFAAWVPRAAKCGALRDKEQFVTPAEAEWFGDLVQSYCRTPVPRQQG